MKAGIIIAALALLLLASLYPSIKRTYAWAGDAHGLIMLAVADREDLEFNPYTANGILMTPETALRVLAHFQYPYTQCVDRLRPVDVCEVPLVMWAGRELGMGGSPRNQRVYPVLEVLLDRGEPVNVLHEGFTAVHEAILFNQPEYLMILLDAGGDPSIRIQHPGKEFDGQDAQQFYGLIQGKRSEDMKEIGRMLESYQ